MKQETELNSTQKIILDNVPNQIDLDTISLIFENYKYCGECDLIDKIELNHNETNNDRQVVIEYSNEAAVQKVLSFGSKNAITYKNYVFKPRAFQPIKQATKSEQSEFSFEIESFKYPFYILKSNKSLLELFKSDLESKLNAVFLIKNENTFTIIKNRTIKQSNEEWQDQIKAYINHFKRTYFSQKQWTNLEQDMWFILRDKAINNYSKTKDLYLILKNEPKDYFIRIEGLKNVIEKADLELNEDMTTASSNSSRKKMRLSNSINNFIHQK